MIPGSEGSMEEKVRLGCTEPWPLFPFRFKRFKHNPLVATLALQYLKRRTRGLEKVIFTATTGRSGTLTLTKLFSDVPGCVAVHEGHPVMNGAVLAAASHGDMTLVNRVYRRVKAVNIPRAAIGHRYYFEANHLFIKSFVGNAIQDFGNRAAVIHLVRPAVEVALSIYALQDYPGTSRGNFWWLDYRAPTNHIAIAPLLESHPEFSHPFYKALWYWHEVEARIAACRAGMPTVRITRFETRWLNDADRVFALFDALGIEYQRSAIKARIGTKANSKEHQKSGLHLSSARAETMASRFADLVGQLSHRSLRAETTGAQPC